MAVLNNAPPPTSDPIARPRRPGYSDENPDPQEGLLSDPWNDHFAKTQELLEQFPARIHAVNLTDQSANIGATDMTDGLLTAGLYRVSYHARVTVNEALSSFDVTLDWQDSVTTRAITGASIDGSLLATFQSASFLIRVAALSPVRYTTTVTSLGTLRYGLDIVLEEVQA